MDKDNIWILVYTKPNQETRANENLRNQGFKTFLPLICSSNRGNANKCLLKNVHDEMVEVPIEYPGDLWVHNNLEHQRDKPLEYFNDDHLKDVYGHNENY